MKNEPDQLLEMFRYLAIKNEEKTATEKKGFSKAILKDV